MNIAIVETTGRGLKLDVDELSEAKITELINEILSNSKYKKNAEEIANRFNDRVMTPEQSVVYWTEYVARHKGAKFLRSIGNDYGMIEFYSVDVYVVISLILFAFTYVVSTVIKILMRKIFKKSEKKIKKN